MPTPYAFAQQVRTCLAHQADAARAQSMAAYMKGQFDFFGVPTPLRRSSVNGLLNAVKPSTDMDWILDACQLLWAHPERECQYVAVDLLVKHCKQLEPVHEPQLAALITSKSWWDSVDLLATHAYGALSRQYDTISATMLRYAVDNNIWLRRVALLHQLTFKSQTNCERLDKVLTANLGHGDFFIRKGMGWALRQYARHNPAWVKNWVTEHDSALSSLTKREALKRMELSSIGGA